MEGISASSEQQTTSMEEISSIANKFGTLTEELKEELNKSIDNGRVRSKKLKEKKFYKKLNNNFLTNFILLCYYLDEIYYELLKMTN